MYCTYPSCPPFSSTRRDMVISSLMKEIIGKDPAALGHPEAASSHCRSLLPLRHIVPSSCTETCGAPMSGWQVLPLVNRWELCSNELPTKSSCHSRCPLILQSVTRLFVARVTLAILMVPERAYVKLALTRCVVAIGLAVCMCGWYCTTFHTV